MSELPTYRQQCKEQAISKLKEGQNEIDTTEN